jgi:Ser/Thr protein kinase RdoA (MazF antagonist)
MQYICIDNPSSQNHLIRLFTFVEGQIMYDVPITAKLVRKAGAYIAEIQNHFKVRLFQNYS